MKTLVKPSDVNLINPSTEIGGKGRNTAWLIQNGFSVPRTLFCTTALFENFVTYIGNIYNDNSVPFNANTFSKIIKVLDSYQFDDYLITFIQEHFKGNSSKLAIRSSATCEDNRDVSFAGMFESVLNVGTHEIAPAIKRVFKSVFSSNVLSYCNSMGIDFRSIEMAVIIQDMVPADKFGVAYGIHSPGDKTTTYIEAGLLDPEAITAGKIIPDRYVVPTSSSSIKFPRVFSRNVLFDFEIEQISELCKRLEPFSKHIDVEWALYEGSLFVLQVRPLSTHVTIPTGNQTHAGLPASPGSCEALVWLWKGNSNHLPVDKSQYILVAEEIELEDSNVIEGFAGVVVEIGGITGHVAIISRELKVPCVIGASEITAIANDGDKIKIDGGTGEIIFPEKPGIQIKHQMNPNNLDLRSVDCDYVTTPYDDVIAYIDHGKYLEVFQILAIADQQIMYKSLRDKHRKPILDGGADNWFAIAELIEFEKLFPNAGICYQSIVSAVYQRSISELSQEIRRILNVGYQFINKYETSTSKRESYKSRYVYAKGAFVCWRAVQSTLFSAAEAVNFQQGEMINDEFTSYVLSEQISDKFTKLGTHAIQIIEVLFDEINNLTHSNIGDINSIRGCLRALKKLTN